MLIRSEDELALYIRNYRKQHKLSQSNIGKLIGLKQDTISAFENNPKGTKLATLFRILSAIELQLDITPRHTKTDAQWNEEW